MVDGPGLYAYVRGNPARLTDPTGKESHNKTDLRKAAGAEYNAQKKNYEQRRQSLEAEEQAWTSESARLRGLQPRDLSGQMQVGAHGEVLWLEAATEAANYHAAISKLDERWVQVETAYRSFAFPQGSIGPDSSIETTEARRLDQFNTAVGAIKNAPLTSMALSAYSIASMIKNGSAGPLTAVQQDTFKNILVVGSGLEAIAMHVAPAAVAFAKKSPSPDTEVPEGSVGAMRRMEFSAIEKHRPKKPGTVVLPIRPGEASPGPVNGQDALDTSVSVKDISPRRVGIDSKEGDFVVFDRTRSMPHPNDGDPYHGHLRTWDDLHNDMRNALIKNGMTDKRGRIYRGGE